MKKLIVAAMALSTLLFVGCGDDDDNGPPPDTTITVTADTMTAPATPLAYDDTVWTSVAATSIPLSISATLPVSPGRSPLGPSRALAAPSSVDLQAIKKDGRLYLRFQWNDNDLSMQREQWKLIEIDGFNFNRQTHLGEDQVWILFDGALDGWDTWNWRVLTTGQLNLAEDGTISSGDTTWDDGADRAAFLNPVRNVADSVRPRYVHVDQWQFTGDILLRSQRLDLDTAYNQVLAGRHNWDLGQTVPGWYVNDDDIDWAAESRWEVQAVYNYDPGIGGPGRYTVVLARDLATGDDEDLDMSELTRIKTRVGILDDYIDLDPGSSQRMFSADFWLALP